MVAHARAAFPQEACGLLAVDDGGCVVHAYLLTNVDASEVSFTLDPDEHFASLTDAEARGWSLGGAFHSHPRSRAVPSGTDVVRALESEWVHVIIGHVDAVEPEVRAWWIRGGEAVEEPLLSSSPEEAPCR